MPRLLPGRPHRDDRVLRQRDGRGRPLTTAEVSRYLEGIRHEYADPRSLILPGLRHAQGEVGHLTPESMAAVAEATGFSEAYVESVATFYDRLYLEPVGRRVVSVCVTLTCMLRGSDELLEHLARAIGLEGHAGTSADGMLTLQEAQCLGACDRAPCLQVDAEETRGPCTAEDADRLVELLRGAPAPERFVR